MTWRWEILTSAAAAAAAAAGPAATLQGICRRGAAVDPTATVKVGNGSLPAPYAFQPPHVGRVKDD